jgi:hypothetical protein
MSKKQMRVGGLGLMLPFAAMLSLWLIDAKVFDQLVMRNRSELPAIGVLMQLAGFALFIGSFAVGDSTRQTRTKAAALIAFGVALMLPFCWILLEAATKSSIMSEAFVWVILFGLIAGAGLLLCLVGISMRASN